MATALITIRGKADRDKIHRWVDGVPDLTRVVFHDPKRSLPQNDKWWACLTDISRQATHHGLKLEPSDWGALFLDALTREVRLLPSLDGTGFVNLRRSSSQLSHKEFSDLIEIVHAWGAANGIIFRDSEQGR